MKRRRHRHNQGKNTTVMSPSPTVSTIHHPENFPVASWLCPPRLRPPIAAIYHFARTADDLADEGCQPATRRLADLAAYGAELQAAARGQVRTDSRWPQVFGPLAHHMRIWSLPLQPLQQLLSAFVQDVRMTEAGLAPSDEDALLDYCKRSANPVGRLLLHLYGIATPEALRQSDAICTALQLINFWQDLSVDLPRGRCYLPQTDLDTFNLPSGATFAELPELLLQPGRRSLSARLLADLCTHARLSMHAGSPLVRQVPGRAGWELRAVVQGGLRVLDKVEALGPAALLQRPRLQGSDWLRIGWRALRMPKHAGHHRMEASPP